MSGDSTAYCLDCLDEIPAKRVDALAKWGKVALYCISCQSRRDEYGAPPPHVMAELSEPDDMTRVREEGWLANG